MPDYTVEELQAWLREKAAGYFGNNPQIDPTWYKELDFHPDEAAFLRAVELGVITVDEAGRCRLPGINRATGNPSEPGQRPRSSGLFSKPETAMKTHVVKLEWREYLTQVIALTELIADYGWPKELVAFDPEARGAWTFDLAVFHDLKASIPWRIVGETKSPSTARELDVLSAELAMWSSTGTTPDASDTSKPAKAFRGLLRTRPAFLWLRAPGRKDETFALRYPNGSRVLLDEVDVLPRNSE